MSELKNRMKGFTIIEVVLVLAIAGLIFLMVFIALPALQGNQRDQQRRSDLGRFASQVSSYQTNNKGAVPLAKGATPATQNVDAFMTNYMRANGDTYTDPGGTNYATAAGTAANAATALTFSTTAPTIYYYPGYVCNGETATTSSARKMAVRMALERGGTACNSN